MLDHYTETGISVIERARVRGSSVKDHYINNTDFSTEAVFDCEKELNNPSSPWALIVKKAVSAQVAGHVLYELTQVFASFARFRKDTHNKMSRH